MATYREPLPIPGWILQMHALNHRLATPHIYRTRGHWFVLHGPQTPLAAVNQAMAWVVKTQGGTACPVRW